MFLKAFAALALLVGVGLYFLHGGYSRTVGRPVDKVAEALTDLDLTSAPGAPGTDASRSGGDPSDFAVAREGNDVVWTVTNGGATAVRLIAHLAPVAADRTEVTLDYQRGEAPDDHVAPAFRSRGVALGLFAMVVEARLDKLTGPPQHAWDSSCDEIWHRFEEGNLRAGGFQNPESGGLTQAMGRTAAMSMRLSQAVEELHAAGCPDNANTGPVDGDGFPVVEDRLGDARQPPEPPRLENGRTYEPGKPMIDTAPASARP